MIVEKTTKTMIVKYFVNIMKQMCNTKLSITPSKESNNSIHRNLKSERLVFFFSFVDFIGLVSALWLDGQLLLLYVALSN